MEHCGSIISLIGFFLASVVAGIVFTVKTTSIGRWLHRRKEWFKDKSKRNPDSTFWETLSRPDAITFMTLITGTFLVFVGQLLLVLN